MFRYLLGWMVPPKVAFLKLTQPEAVRRMCKYQLFSGRSVYSVLVVTILLCDHRRGHHCHVPKFTQHQRLWTYILTDEQMHVIQDMLVPMSQLGTKCCGNWSYQFDRKVFECIPRTF